MVLRDLGDPSSSDDGLTDYSYASDSDPYSSSSSSSSSSTSRFDSSVLPQPIPVLGPLIGFPERLVRYRTNATIQFAEKKIGRAVTQEEGQALASHLYQMEQTDSYCTAFGVGLGAWRCYATAATNRYPMFLPKQESINPNKFLFIKGPLAQYCRHSWRALLYMFAAGELGKLCGRILAQPIAAHGTANDPRMVTFTEDLRRANKVDTQRAQELAKDRHSRHDRQQAANRDQPGQTESSSAGTPRNPFPFRQATPPSSQDDMSPTAGSDPWSSASDGGSSFSPDTTQDSPPKPESYRRPQSASPWDRQPSSPESDDASPTGGLFQDEVQSQSRPGESSWDRLRRGGGPPAGQLPPPPPRRSESQHREPRGNSSSSDSFPFAESGEERDGVRARAQEFDTRMQLEREGKDFNDEKRW